MTPPAKALLRALLGLALLAAVLALADLARVLALVRQAQWGWVAAGLAAGIASNLVSALRWRALARWLGCAPGSADACRWYFQGISLNALLPGAVVGGDVYRAVQLHRAEAQRATPPRAAAAGWSVLLDRLSGLWMLCALGGVGAAACAAELAPWVRMAPALLAALALAGTLLWLALPWALPRLLRGVHDDGAPRPGWLGTLAEAAHRPGFGAQLGWQSLASLAVQALSAAALACGGLALGVHIGAAAWAFAIAPVFLMAALPVSVGGWGTREAAAVAALAPFGVAPAAAVGVGVFYGLYGLAQALLGSLAFGLPTRIRPKLQNL